MDLRTNASVGADKEAHRQPRARQITMQRHAGGQVKGTERDWSAPCPYSVGSIIGAAGSRVRRLGPGPGALVFCYGRAVATFLYTFWGFTRLPQSKSES